MKPLWKFCILAAAAVTAITLWTSCERQDTATGMTPTLVVGTTATYPPYESVNAAGKVEGFDIDVIEAVAAKLGKKVLIKDASFDALILSLKQHKVDVIIGGISITPYRLKEIAMVPYQGEETKGLVLAFWKAAPAGVTTLADIAASGKPVVAVMESTYQEGYLKKVEGIEAKSLETNADLIMDIQYGKSASVLFEPHIAEAMKGKFPQLQLMPFPLPEQEWVLGNGIGINKDDQAMITGISQAVQELKDEGAIAEMEHTWFGGGVQ